MAILVNWQSAFIVWLLKRISVFSFQIRGRNLFFPVNACFLFRAEINRGGIQSLLLNYVTHKHALKIFEGGNVLIISAVVLWQD